MNIRNNMTELVGNTPLVFLNNMTKGCYARVAVKMESHNPLGSVKDRIALGMLNKMERDGVIRKGDTIVESTSGNTGIGIAWVARVKGYKTKFVMPHKMSLERRCLLRALGGDLVLTDAARGMGGANAKAEQLAKQRGHIWARQFDNFANPQYHFATTGPEIYRDTNGQMDYFVAGVGTGGTVTGVAKFFKGLWSDCKFIAVEPTKSPMMSQGKKGPHGIQGIGAGFIPGVMDMPLIDGIKTVTEDEAINTARKMALEEGIFGGISRARTSARP